MDQFGCEMCCAKELNNNYFSVQMMITKLVHCLVHSNQSISLIHLQYVHVRHNITINYTLTCFWLVHIKSQLTTHHFSIVSTKAKLTHSSPCLSYTHFHSPLVGSRATHQLHCSMNAATMHNTNI